MSSQSWKLPIKDHMMQEERRKLLPKNKLDYIAYSAIGISKTLWT